MTRLCFRTKTDPRGREWSSAQIKTMSCVYFAAHPQDYQRYMHVVAEELYRTHDFVFCYDTCPKEAYDETLLSDLEHMDLFVIPITTALLTDPQSCRVLQQDLAFAEAHKIPILPLMQEQNLGYRYGQIDALKTIQFLDRFDSDGTALPYTQKLQAFLNGALLSEAQVQQVREAFSARIFLSYRKKERKQAQDLMRLIHADPALLDVAIWYDEFLTPGEDFNENIRQALGEANLFALAVTPYLLEAGNYVIENEYPAALDLEKVILPVELEPIDPPEWFDQTFLKNEARQAQIEKLVQPLVKDRGAVQSEVRRVLKDCLNIKVTEKQEANHLYLMGVAYLRGLEVERDVDKAIGLLEAAAAQGNIGAMTQLTEVYTVGYGARPDETVALKYNKALVARCKELYAQGEVWVKSNLIHAMLALANKLFETGVRENLQEAQALMLDLIDNFEPADYREHTDPAIFAKVHHNLALITSNLEPLAEGDKDQIIDSMKNAIGLLKFAQKDCRNEDAKKALLKETLDAGAVCLSIDRKKEAQNLLSEAKALYPEDWASIQDYQVLGDLARLEWERIQIADRKDDLAALQRVRSLAERIPEEKRDAVDWALLVNVMMEQASKKSVKVLLETKKLKGKVVKRLEKEMREHLEEALVAARRYVQEDGKSVASREKLCSVLSKSISIYRLQKKMGKMEALMVDLQAEVEMLKDIAGDAELMRTLCSAFAAIGKSKAERLEDKKLPAGEKETLLNQVLQAFSQAEGYIEEYERRAKRPDVINRMGAAFSKGCAYENVGAYELALKEYNNCEALFANHVQNSPTNRGKEETALLSTCLERKTQLLKKNPSLQN